MLLYVTTSSFHSVYGYGCFDLRNNQRHWPDNYPVFNQLFGLALCTYFCSIYLLFHPCLLSPSTLRASNNILVSWNDVCASLRLLKDSFQSLIIGLLHRHLEMLLLTRYRELDKLGWPTYQGDDLTFLLLSVKLILQKELGQWQHYPQT